MSLLNYCRLGVLEMTDLLSPDLVALFKSDPEQATKYLTALLQPAIESSVPPVVDKMLVKMGYSEEVSGLVTLLAARSNDSKSEVLRKATTLYGLALDALEKGNKLAIIDSKDMILHDIIGFDNREFIFKKIGV